MSNYSTEDSWKVDKLTKNYMSTHAGVSYRDALHAVTRELSQNEAKIYETLAGVSPERQNVVRFYNQFFDNLAPTRDEVKQFAATLLDDLARQRLPQKHTAAQYKAEVRSYLRESAGLKLAYDGGYWDGDIRRDLLKFLDSKTGNSTAYKFEKKSVVKSY